MIFNSVKFYAYSSLFNFIATFLLALFIILNNFKPKVNRFYTYFIFCTSFWALFYYFWLSTSDVILADYFVRTCMMGVLIFPPIFTHFIMLFTKINLLSRGENITNYLLGVLGATLVYTPFFAKIGGSFYCFPYWPKPGPLFHLFIVYFFLNIILSYGLLLKKYFSTQESVTKNQIRYLLVTIIFGVLGGPVNFLPWYRLPILPGTIILFSLWVIIPAYAIIKHRLLDIKVAFTRGAILLFVYGFIVGIPLSLAMIGKPLLIKYFQTQWFFPPLGLYTILALLAPYIYLRFQNQAEEKRMQQQVRLHQSLKAASKTTIEVQSIDKLSKIIPRYLLKLYKKLDNKIMHISMFLHDKDNKVYHMQSSVGEQKIPVDTLIREGSMLVKWFTIIRDRLVDEGVLRANEVEVLVYEDIDYWMNNPNVLKKPFKGLDKVLRELKRIMESFNASLILPSVYQKELLGFLILGEKTPDPYSISDISTFSILANDSAMAFKAAQLFEDLKVAQARLIQSEKLNLLGQLASSMAHEINNPLAIISGNVELLLLDETDESKKKFLQKISDQTERGYKIIHRLLNFSRLPKEEIKVIKVHEMIDETLELIGHKIKHGNIELIKEYNEVPEINGNPTQIQEVLLNLFVNGIQSMQEGGTLKITTTEIKHKVEILITDTGKGIDEKDIQNIFDPFYTKGKEDGTGLGLFVASQVMGLHKGTIDVKSKVGQGTTFVLQFGLEKN
ncbi:MAG: hypothetical protein KKD05_03255 [Candidatus Omnitrophica bacterium]|nr:hypothetical protein [Candidatus Omnitrophota bacterium]